ncbi:hypothetical protein B0A49_07303 [Cryomyces minteri]|uniref:GP-PDE domain-containing protein n=2 Tax=Cryomyces TaxID=329878 RepID=A0A4V5NEP8_9PEZI|nr:hypothetical protein B0A49_07303 [Cryomyces minteri]
MGAFAGAVDVGAHAIETDVHLSKDGVVVLSHDATLKRCYGRPDKIIDCSWDYLSSLRTLKEPRSPMPRLQDLLEYLASPGLEDIWLMLDIKLDNNADDIMRLIASTIRAVPPSPMRAWSKRIVLGCWATKFLPLCDEYIPGFPVSHIGFSTAYARQFFNVPNVSFNMLLPILMGPCGPSFIKKCKRQGREVLAWTVNDEKKMRWCVKRELDGVITDDPKKFLEVCEKYDEDSARREWLPFVFILDIIRVNIFAFLYALLLRWRYGSEVDQRYMKKIRPRIEE